MQSITVLAAIELRIRFLVLLLSWIYIIRAAIELRLLVLVLLLYFVDTIGVARERTRDNMTSITLIAAIELRIRFLDLLLSFGNTIKAERTQNDMPGNEAAIE
jgi:hypothetical protein